MRSALILVSDVKSMSFVNAFTKAGAYQKVVTAVALPSYHDWYIMVCMDECVIDGCTKTANRSGKTLCEAHYYRIRRYRSADVNKRPELEMTLSERLLAKVDKSGSFWTWTGHIDQGGYGRFQLNNRWRFAHRVAYETLSGPIPDGMDLDHLCRVRHCVNPDHLEAVSHRENVLRGEGLAARQARTTHCPKGHPYSEESTRHYAGRRFCRECNRLRKR